MNDFLISGGVPVSLYSKILTFRDGNKSFKVDGEILETIKNYDFNVNHANPQDQKSINEFGKDMKFDIKQKERKSNRDKSRIELLKSPAIMAFGISKTMFLSSDPDELCKRLKFLLQVIHAIKTIPIQLIKKLLL